MSSPARARNGKERERAALFMEVLREVDDFMDGL
jgi:hypothetical protein